MEVPPTHTLQIHVDLCIVGEDGKAMASGGMLCGEEGVEGVLREEGGVGAQE